MDSPSETPASDVFGPQTNLFGILPKSAEASVSAAHRSMLRLCYARSLGFAECRIKTSSVAGFGPLRKSSKPGFERRPLRRFVANLTTPSDNFFRTRAVRRRRLGKSIIRCSVAVGHEAPDAEAQPLAQPDTRLADPDGRLARVVVRDAAFRSESRGNAASRWRRGRSVRPAR